MNLDSLRDTFFAECEELIESLAEGLSDIAGGSRSKETINAIFRAVHSIKGAAGSFGFEHLVRFAHRYETVLDLIRSDRLDIDSRVLALITRSADNLAALVDSCRAEDGAPTDATADLIAELEAIASVGVPSSGQEFAFAALAVEEVSFAPLATAAFDMTLAAVEGFFISFAPARELYANGHEPARIFAALGRLGALEVTCDASRVPDLAQIDPEESYLRWSLRLTGTDDEAAVRDAFAFVEGLCDLEIDPIEAPAPADAEAETDPTADVFSPAQTSGPAGEIELGRAQGPAAVPQKVETAKTTTPAPAVQSTLRVDPERVDRLINIVGELIINHAVINQKLGAAGVPANSELTAALDDYRYLAREIQESVMAIRAQPVKSLFQRMGRVVREAATATGKSVELYCEGEATEIDKTMLERLSDPLTHMLRNAVDHGIETPSCRADAGKPGLGSVRLSAAHRSGHVVIEISDDGAGLNQARILAKAIEKGLVPPDAKLSEPEIFALLFAPGFSTAESVTNLSGRGVGMDVVMTTITSLGGKVGIASVPGAGSTFTISLPLTLAVLDGMIVGVGRETMVLPLSAVIETVRINARNLHEIGPGEWVVSVRGTHVRVADLGALLGMRPTGREGGNRALILVDAGGTSIGIVVDDILDQRQVVIKSLEGNFRAIRGISAATILGDGKVALIIDPDALAGLLTQNTAVRQLAEMEV